MPLRCPDAQLPWPIGASSRVWLGVANWAGQAWPAQPLGPCPSPPAQDSPTVVVEDLRLCTVKPCEDIERRFCFEVVSPTK